MRTLLSMSLLAGVVCLTSQVGPARAAPAPALVSSLLAQARARVAVHGAARDRIVRGPSSAAVVEGGLAVMRKAGGLEAGVGIGVTTEGGLRQLKLIAHQSKRLGGRGVIASVGIAGYEGPVERSIPTVESRSTSGGAVLAGYEYTSQQSSYARGAPTVGAARVAVGAGILDNDSGRVNETRRNLTLTLSPTWKSKPLRQTEKALRLAERAVDALEVTQRSGSDEAMSIATTKIAELARYERAVEDSKPRLAP